MGFEKKQVGGSYVEREKLPIDFYRFLCDISAHAAMLCIENQRFRRVVDIAGTILAVRGVYLNKPSRECFQMFYEHIQQPYRKISREVAEITGQNYDDMEIFLGLSLEELKQLDDARINADSHTKFTVGKFQIKEWRENV